jgi:hypothetical protein
VTLPPSQRFPQLQDAHLLRHGEYLVNWGIKAANVPLVPNMSLPKALDKVNCAMIGLILQPDTPSNPLYSLP